MFNPLMQDVIVDERRRELLDSAARERFAGSVRQGRRHRLTTWVNRTFRSTVR